MSANRQHVELPDEEPDFSITDLSPELQERAKTVGLFGRTRYDDRPKPGRPREEHVPTKPGSCPEHGEVELRGHANGRGRLGQQRYRWRCPACDRSRGSREYAERKLQKK